MPRPDKPVVMRKLAAAKRTGTAKPAQAQPQPPFQPQDRLPLRTPLTAGMSPAELATALDATLSDLAVDAPADTRERLLAYLRLLQKWNATYNLTALRGSESILTHHLADCLAVIPSLQRHLAASPLPADLAHQLLDVGSGGGLPGVVLALLMPQLSVTCVDTVGKKAAFIRQAALELGLANLRAEHSRVEKLSGRYGLITSRAFASLADFTAWTRHLLAPGASWMAMKGRQPQDELTALPDGVRLVTIEDLRVPGLDAERCLVWLEQDQ